MSRLPRRLVLAVALAALAEAMLAAAAFGSTEKDVGGAALSAADIYGRAIRNLMESAIAEISLVSTGPGGHAQRFEVEMMWRRYPEASAEAREGVLSRALARYLEPFDLRESGVYVVNRRDQLDEQFVYVASSRRVRRLNLRGQNVFGTDFAVEDVVPRGVHHAEYRRVEDAHVDGVACYVVDASFRDTAEERYSRGRFWVEKGRFVPLRVRYWDKNGVADKELHIDRASIRDIDDLHVPIEMQVVSLVSGSSTRLRVTALVVNPDLSEELFSVRRLEQHATSGLPRSYFQGAHEFEDTTLSGPASRSDSCEAGRGGC